MSISSVDSGPLHVKPVVDLNLTTEANRVLYVLNKIISRARLAGLLPFFINNEGHLKNILEPSVLSHLHQACDKIHLGETNVSESSSTSTEVSSESSYASEKISKSNWFPESKATRDDPPHEDDANTADDDDPDMVDVRDYNDEVFDAFPSSSIFSVGSPLAGNVFKEKNRKENSLDKVIYMLEENQEVQELAKTLEKELSREMKHFIKCLTEFKNRMELRLIENATQYKTREKYMRETYEKNERAKSEIEKLEDELVVTKTDANVCLIGRNILINRHQNKIEKIHKNSQEAIEKRIKESEKTMVNDWHTSIIEQERLKMDFHQASEKYSSVLKDHLAIEKALRAKRTKVENQVLGWIQKFDQDIGEKQAEEEEIQALLDQETSEVNEIQAKLDEQEEEYDELMQEKAAFEEEMLERRLYHFIVNRSARRIQRTYRMYKARKLAKKLAKKGKKGKKNK